jgi:hypothetical protein
VIREAVQEDTLAHLIGQGVAREFLVRRGPGGEGWTLAVRLSSKWLPVRSRREPLRVWASLTAIGNYAQKMGIRDFSVEL